MLSDESKIEFKFERQLKREVNLIHNKFTKKSSVALSSISNKFNLNLKLCFVRFDKLNFKRQVVDNSI